MVRLAQYLPGRVRETLRRRLVRVEMAQVYQLVLDPGVRPLTGKTAVVTGASGAIGRAIAIKLAVDGATVVAVARGADKLEALVAEIASLGGDARPQAVDLTDSAALQDLANRVGPLDILVNNAGGSSRGRNAHIWEQSAEVFDDVLNVNLRAAMVATSAFGSHMVAGGRGGRIINLGSTVAVGGLSKFSDYAAAKAGIVGFTRSAALEFGPYGVTVNCVTPGIVERGQITRDKVERTLKKAVMPALGRAEDISQMVGFLAGPGGSWITGQEFIVDGGRSIGLHGEP